MQNTCDQRNPSQQIPIKPFLVHLPHHQIHNHKHHHNHTSQLLKNNLNSGSAQTTETENSSHNFSSSASNSIVPEFYENDSSSGAFSADPDWRLERARGMASDRILELRNQSLKKDNNIKHLYQTSEDVSGLGKDLRIYRRESVR